MYTIPYEYRVQPENLQILIKFMSFVIQTAEATPTNPAIIETLTNWNEKVLETRIVLMTTIILIAVHIIIIKYIIL